MTTLHDQFGTTPIKKLVLAGSLTDIASQSTGYAPNDGIFYRSSMIPFNGSRNVCARQDKAGYSPNMPKGGVQIQKRIDNVLF